MCEWAAGLRRGDQQEAVAGLQDGLGVRQKDVLAAGDGDNLEFVGIEQLVEVGDRFARDGTALRHLCAESSLVAGEIEVDAGAQQAQQIEMAELSVRGRFLLPRRLRAIWMCSR